MTFFVKKLMQMRDPGCLIGRGALELNSQPCDETQRNIHERDELLIQHEEKENQGMSSGRRNRIIVLPYGILLKQMELAVTCSLPVYK